MTYTEGSTYGVTLDPRWTHGTFVDRDNPEYTWDLPFIGWTTEVVYVDDPHSSTGANRTEVAALFWDEETKSPKTVNGQHAASGIRGDLTALHGPAAPRQQSLAEVAADGAWHSVWLHGNWRWLTQNMTTEERDHAAASVERVWAAMREQDGEDIGPETRADLWWWRAR